MSNTHHTFTTVCVCESVSLRDGLYTHMSVCVRVSKCLHQEKYKGIFFILFFMFTLEKFLSPTSPPPATTTQGKAKLVYTLLMCVLSVEKIFLF